MAALYLKWQNDFYIRHQTIYYDVTLGRLMYINGSRCHERREPLMFDLGGIQIPLGFEGLGSSTEAVEGKPRLANNTPYLIRSRGTYLHVYYTAFIKGPFTCFFHFYPEILHFVRTLQLILLLLFQTDMFLLGFLEEKLETIASWPTCVLRLLFAEEPNTMRITTVAAFFYGNSLPLNAALSFYLTCNDSEPILVRRIMTEYYDEWHATPDTPWKVIYYKMA
jgi:hypothetical protein